MILNIKCKIFSQKNSPLTCVFYKNLMKMKFLRGTICKVLLTSYHKILLKEINFSGRSIFLTLITMYTFFKFFTFFMLTKWSLRN